jgi:serine protease Do
MLLVVAISATSAVGTVWVYNSLAGKTAGFVQGTSDAKLPVNYAGYFDNISAGAEPVDFTKAASAAVPAVVHIKTKIPAKKVTNNLPRSRGNSMEDWFNEFFEMGPRVQPEQRASGSGVIISEDGYIVTNNHVVSNGGEGVADEITVTMSNKKTFKAKVIGRDPSSDIAVLKIDGTSLPYMIYGNSDNVKLGQWVLAVGYPLTLETTVTAGIVSAKGRAIGINNRQSDTPIESFIQTDAAVNQGNSGGALISTDGQLIGINSAILAPSGTYAGYSFAIPVNLVKKIVNDLVKFGDVKRPYLGISAADERYNSSDGAYVGLVAPDGAAAEIGLKKGDIITRINDNTISSWPELQGTIASYNAGDKVKITYKRDGKEYNGMAVLKSKVGSYDQVAKTDISQRLGADLETISKEKAKQYEVNGGVLVKKINKGTPIGKTRMEEGFVITSVNGIDIVSIEQLARVLARADGTSVRLEGFYPGYEGNYTYPLTLEEQ